MSESTRRTFTEEEVFNLELKAHNAGAMNGRNAERRRIIKMLEEHLERLWNNDQTREFFALADVIASIQKEIEEEAND